MSVLKELLEKRDAAHNELKEIALTVREEQRDLYDTEQKRVDELVALRDDLDARIKKENKRAKRDDAIAEARKNVEDAETRSDKSDDGVKAEVTSEPMVYGDGSPYSYFTDLARITAGHQWTFDPAATERMALWAHQVEREFANDSEFGKTAGIQLRNQFRTETAVETDRRLREARDRGRAGVDAKEMELRTGVTTGGGATAAASGGGGAAFVTPVFFVSDYAPYREAGRAFIDQCNKQPLPSYGMTAYMPAVQSKAGVSTQSTEGVGSAEVDPTVGYLTGSLVTKMGNVTVTQQLLDRAGPNFEFDRMIFDQLQRDYNAQVDTYALTTALATAGTVAWNSGSYTLPLLVQRVAGAINAIETTNGTVMSPTHVFMQPSRWNFAEAAGIDSQNRPLIVPNQAGPFNAFGSGNQTGAVNYEGDTGYKILGLPVFKDLNIPAPTSGADQVIVANLREVYVYEGPCVTRALPQTLGNNLQVILQLYAYVTEIVRYQAAVQTVTGSQLATIVFSS